MMKALIIEDELLARRSLIRTITTNFPDIEIIGECGSIAQSVALLKQHTPDIIFMDVELEDGGCFEIFKQVEVSAKVVITTAYDSYAIKAFEAGSVDYLLKPVELQALRRAIQRCQAHLQSIESAPKRSYKSRYILSIGNQIVPIDCDNIAYIYSQDKSNYIVTSAAGQCIIDQSLESIMAEIDPVAFFQTSRGCIVARSAIKGITKLINGRIRLSVEPHPDQEIVVSRARVDDFMDWLRRD